MVKLLKLVVATMVLGAATLTASGQDNAKKLPFPGADKLPGWGKVQWNTNAVKAKSMMVTKADYDAKLKQVRFVLEATADAGHPPKDVKFYDEDGVEIKDSHLGTDCQPYVNPYIGLRKGQKCRVIFALKSGLPQETVTVVIGYRDTQLKEVTAPAGDQ